MRSPYLNDDGSHVIPITQVKYASCECHSNATGELRWSPEVGATLEVQLPGVSRTELPKYFKHRPASINKGRIHEKTKSPDWTGQTADGLSVEIFELNACPISTEEIANREYKTFSSVKVTVINASVELTKDNQLAFWHQTPEETRMLCLGFNISSWQSTDEITYEEDGTQKTRWRGVTELSTTPHIRLYSAGNFNLPDGIESSWLVTDQFSDGWGYPSRVEQGFISFLNGKRTHFFWHDSFLGSKELRRTYYGWHKERLSDLGPSHWQPIPLYGTGEAITHSKEVVAKLAKLFGMYVSEADEMQLSWILNPLWSASKCILEDQFALVCISLERLASAWHRKSSKVKSKPFFQPKQLERIRNTISTSIQPILKELGEDQKSVLSKRIDNICAPPNADKLSAIFMDLGISLGPLEQQILKDRNKPFHGTPTLGDANDIDELNREAIQCNHLRVLITKAILKILKYEGPFVNYASAGHVQIENL